MDYPPNYVIKYFYLLILKKYQKKDFSEGNLRSAARPVPLEKSTYFFIITYKGPFFIPVYDRRNPPLQLCNLCPPLKDSYLESFI